MRKPPDPPPGLIAVDPREWTRVWLRVIASTSVKCVGFACASFADYRDGAEIHPGNALLATICGMSKRTVISSLAEIRDWGLIWRYEEGSKNGVKGMADVYRLTFPDGIFGRVPLLDPEWQMPAIYPLNQVNRLHLVVDNEPQEDTLRNRNQVN